MGRWCDKRAFECARTPGPVWRPTLGWGSETCACPIYTTHWNNPSLSNPQFYLQLWHNAQHPKTAQQHGWPSGHNTGAKPSSPRCWGHLTASWHDLFPTNPHNSDVSASQAITRSQPYCTCCGIWEHRCRLPLFLVLRNNILQKETPLQGVAHSMQSLTLPLSISNAEVKYTVHGRSLMLPAYCKVWY